MTKQLEMLIVVVTILAFFLMMAGWFIEWRGTAHLVGAVAFFFMTGLNIGIGMGRVK